MMDYIITALDALSALMSDIDIVADDFFHRLKSAGNLRLASIILMVLALILLIFMIVVLYIKSFVTMVYEDNENSKEDQPSNFSFFEEDEEQELERQQEEQDREELERLQQEQRLREEQLEKENQAKEQSESRKKEQTVALDWQKGKLKELEQDMQALSDKQLSYHSSSKDIRDLIGLLIDMLSRGVDDYKIAQTMMYKTGGKAREDDILQLIESIKDFIALSINNRFEVLKNKDLPDAATALYHLANGDTSLALLLMENLMDYNIERTASLKQEARKDNLLKETSCLSTTFGSLASLSDIKLAAEAFELSVELNPDNINAWNKLADMYGRSNMHKKAVWAYESILRNAAGQIYQRQIAHAQKMLAYYYHKKGDSLNASKLYNSSKQFYDSIGINHRLEKQEIEIIDLIESKNRSDIQQIIQTILNTQTFSRYSYT